MARLSNQHAPTKPNQLCTLAVKVDEESIDYPLQFGIYAMVKINTLL